ncbi:ketoacyl-ACP synthase III [Paenibacillus yanchengensis]|uniref:Beta-ketoacyl-[acyl-carrier-protein] synthase III n=1 Tax=Paenibacillus yanchengensis TaxID=2035833 RepID=A0ABW4YQD4_9BACL
MTKTTPPFSTARITAIGTYTPDRVLTNEELEQMIETSDEWIVKRTGIRTRRIAAEQEFTSDLIFAAIENMLSRYPVELSDVDYIIVATSTPDTIFPSMAARVQAKFSIAQCGAIDVSAACAGFTASIQLANSLLLSGVYKKILVVGADAMSKITDYTDRSTCILFGDGAGAIVMEYTTDQPGCLLASFSRTDGNGGHQVYLSQLAPTIEQTPIQTNGKIVQNGREVYRWAVTNVSKGIQQLLADHEYTIDDIDWFVPHSANMRIVEAILERTGIPREKTLTSMEQFGNTSAASIPLALDQAVQQGIVKQGDNLLLYGFGGGLTEAAVFIRW